MTPEQCELLAGVERGTPMGELLRRFWFPALLSSELEADGAPVRVRLLGENLVAFRDSRGRVGLLSESCSHRGASLYYARNGGEGLRCWYHGWKYDVQGRCIETPNEPPSNRLGERIAQRAYKCVERNGAVWTYMGPRDDVPPLPQLEWVTVPASHVYVSKRLQRCHWTQGMDGDLDSSHLPFLHQGPISSRAGQADAGWLLNDRVPRLEAVPTKSGLLLGARRRADASSFYWRVNQWFLPNFTTIPLGGDSPQAGHAWVPIDGGQSWVFTFSWHPARPLKEEELARMRSGNNVHAPLIPGTFLPKYNRDNGYAEADVVARQPWMRITDLQAQDMAATESMGPLYDRTYENLGMSDLIIVQARRRLMEAARHLEQHGELPAFDAASYALRPFSVKLGDGESWQDAVRQAIVAGNPDTYRISA